MWVLMGLELQLITIKSPASLYTEVRVRYALSAAEEPQHLGDFIWRKLYPMELNKVKKWFRKRNGSEALLEDADISNSAIVCRGKQCYVRIKPIKPCGIVINVRLMSPPGWTTIQIVYKIDKATINHYRTRLLMYSSSKSSAKNIHNFKHCDYLL